MTPTLDQVSEVRAANGPAKRVAWHLGHLDALRGIAVLGVLMVHSSDLSNGGPIYGLTDLAQRLTFTGQRGVQLFFVVSAFTLFLSRKNRHELHPTRNFFLRRLFRLSPMFYVAAILTRVLWPGHIGPVKTLLSLVYLNGFSPLTIHSGTAGGWSVADEAVFYLTLPFLFRWIRTLRSSLIWLAVSLPVCFFSSQLLTGIWPQYSEYFTFLGFTVEWSVFLMGIVAFFLWNDVLKDSGTPSQRRSLSLMLLISGVLLYLGQLPFTNNNLFGTSAVCVILLIALSLHSWPLLVNRATILLGRISYSLYLLHFFVIVYLKGWIEHAMVRHTLLQRPKAHFAVVFFGTLLIAGFIATLTWKFIEEPGILLGRRLIQRLENQTRAKDVLSLTSTRSTPDAQF